MPSMPDMPKIAMMTIVEEPVTVTVTQEEEPMLSVAQLRARNDAVHDTTPSAALTSTTVEVDSEPKKKTKTPNKAKGISKKGEADPGTQTKKKKKKKQAAPPDLDLELEGTGSGKQSAPSGHQQEEAPTLPTTQRERANRGLDLARVRKKLARATKMATVLERAKARCEKSLDELPELKEAAREASHAERARLEEGLQSWSRRFLSQLTAEHEARVDHAQGARPSHHPCSNSGVEVGRARAWRRRR